MFKRHCQHVTQKRLSMSHTKLVNTCIHTLHIRAETTNRMGWWQRFQNLKTKILMIAFLRCQREIKFRRSKPQSNSKRNDWTKLMHQKSTDLPHCWGSKWCVCVHVCVFTWCHPDNDHTGSCKLLSVWHGTELFFCFFFGPARDHHIKGVEGVYGQSTGWHLANSAIVCKTSLAVPARPCRLKSHQSAANGGLTPSNEVPLQTQAFIMRDTWY